MRTMFWGSKGPKDLGKLGGGVVLLTYIDCSVNLLCCIPGQVEKTEISVQTSPKLSQVKKRKRE